MAQPLSSHLVSQILTNEESPRLSKAPIHNGSAMSSTDGQAIAPGGSGMSQGIGGSIGKTLSSAKLESPFGGGKIDGFMDSLNQNAVLGKNPFEVFDGTMISPVANPGFAAQMQEFSSMQKIEIKSALGSINADIAGHTGVISQQQGGQSH
jgi:hypothetical protein